MFKKYPSGKCEKSCKWGQRQANKRIRASQDVPNRKAYKKFYNTWNICDYKFVAFTPKEIREYEKYKRK